MGLECLAALDGESLPLRLLPGRYCWEELYSFDFDYGQLLDSLMVLAPGESWVSGPRFAIAEFSARQLPT
jgi:hypothetical protein